jgi:hypothetical protein
LSHTG